MSASPAFSTQILGQTENALNAILERELAGTGINEPQWVTLVVAVTGDGKLTRGELVARISDALKLSESEVDAHVAVLVSARLVETPEQSPLTVTAAGQELYATVRGTVTEITQRMWGDLPAEDLATSGRVLGTILTRANAELAAGRRISA